MSLSYIVAQVNDPLRSGTHTINDIVQVIGWNGLDPSNFSFTSSTFLYCEACAACIPYQPRDFPLGTDQGNLLARPKNSLLAASDGQQ